MAYKLTHQFLSIVLLLLMGMRCSYSIELDETKGNGELTPEISSSASNGYTPVKVPCPKIAPVIREPHGLSPEETAWLNKRRQHIKAPLRDLLHRVNIPNFNSNAYLDKVGTGPNLPNIGIAMSGGGYRALLVGAGATAAFDDRTTGSKNPGHLGGLLQSSTYVSGLSGGGWLVGSLFVNNFTSVQKIITGGEGSKIWHFGRSLIEGPPETDIPILSELEYWRAIYNQVKGKVTAGFDSSLTDYWARGLAYQMLNAVDGGPGYTWSSIADQPQFVNGEIPLPFLVACQRARGEIVVAPNATIFEFSPWEMGSWDPTLFGMAPIKYVGSNFTAGKLSDGTCISGFDNAAFVMATSSSLFNSVVANIFNTKMQGILTVVSDLLHAIAKSIDKANDDIASWTPNPFRGWNPTKNKVASHKILGLVDGGEDDQNIPLYPHMQKPRKVDVIFAVDSSADTGNFDGWPNGTSLVAAYRRHRHGAIRDDMPFPSIPDTNTFVNLGLNARPTFFGCDPKNISGPAPIIVYIPNYPYSYYTNFTTLTASIKKVERNDIIRNGYNVATMGNGTLDKEWPVCVGCAILSRSFYRSGTNPPSACQECFKRHCWNGTIDSRKPPPFLPKRVIP